MTSFARQLRGELRRSHFRSPDLDDAAFLAFLDAQRAATPAGDAGRFYLGLALATYGRADALTLVIEGYRRTRPFELWMTSLAPLLPMRLSPPPDADVVHAWLVEHVAQLEWAAERDCYRMGA